MFKKLFTKQLASVIEWNNQADNELFHKITDIGDEIKNASKLIVQPGQGCILVYEGKVKEVLSEAGSYTIATSNHPFITSLLKIKQGFTSEHKLYLYFFRQAELVNQKWGTATPIKYNDPVYKFPLELGAYGNFSLKVTEPQAFFENFVANKNSYTSHDVKQLLTTRITPEITSYLAERGYSYQQIDGQLATLATELKNNLNSTFQQLGLLLTDFRIEATSFSEETTKRINKVANMTAEALAASEVGLDYVELEKLRAMRDAASNTNGVAGAGLQMGVGLELAKTLNTTETSSTTASGNNDVVEQLKKLKFLLDEGILTEEEFTAKKKEILARL